MFSLVVVKETIVRDTQIADTDELVIDADGEIDEEKTSWRDFSGQVVLGIWKGNKNEAINIASKRFNIKECYLDAYELKNETF